MKLFIPSAGYGTRLRPITEIIPKPIIKFKKKEHLLEIISELQKYDFSHIIINTSYLADKIINLMRTENTKDMSIFREETPLGMFGGLYNAISVFPADDYFIFNSDIEYEGDLSEMLSTEGDAVFGLLDNKKGDMLIDNEGNVIKIARKKVLNERNWHGYSGIMLIRKSMIHYLKGRFKRGDALNFVDDLFESISGKFTLRSYILPGSWRDLGNGCPE